MEKSKTQSGKPDGSNVKKFPNGDKALWSQFAEATTAESFCRSWLAIQCRMIEGVLGALVLLGKPDEGPYKPVAVWPDAKRNMEHLTPAAEQALIERRGVFVKSEPTPDGDPSALSSYYVAYPVEVTDKLHGVVVLDVRFRPEPQLQAVLRQLHWGMAWLEVMFRRGEGAQDVETKDRLITVLDLVAVGVEQENYRGASTAFVTELATRIKCERVSLGFMSGRHVRVTNLSHSADFGKKMDLINCISAAMEEAIDQQTVIVYPEPDGAEPYVTRAHEELTRKLGTGAICTIPLFHRGKYFGALTLERPADNPFEPQTVELCESLASLIGPVLDEKRKNDRWLIRKAADSMKVQLGKFIGPRHIALKLITVLLIGIVIFFYCAMGEYRVSAKAILEGEVQRAIVAPFNSFVAEEKVRAGDLVNEGDLLTALDDRDLKLERIKWLSEKEQLLKQYRESLAKRDRARISIVKAQIGQAEAQISLLDEHLARMNILAPFDGLIVSGDLSQSLGAPVERGEVLFEIAPLDDYRIILEVNEREITQIKRGQRGELVLSSMPNEMFPLLVKKITPVSSASEGQNSFRVEAILKEKSERLRPGMEGVGKIYIDQRKLIWIWTHDMIDWIRLWVWSWWP